MTIRHAIVLMMACMMSTMYSVDFTITQNDIDMGLVITTSGVWQLSESVTFTSACAIEINTIDDVILDLNNFTIDGLGTGQTAIKVVDSSSVQIKNGFITAVVGNAVTLTNSPFFSLHTLTITDTALDALVITSSSSGYVRTCGFAMAQQRGITIVDSANVNCVSCVISACTLGGVAVSGFSDNTCFENCVADSNQGSGFDIDAQLCVFNACSASMNTGMASHGFVLQGDNHILKQCSASKNEASGVVIYGDSIMVQFCTCVCNGQHGALLESTSTNITCLASVFGANGVNGIRNLGATSNVSRFGMAQNNGALDWYNILNKNY